MSKCVEITPISTLKHIPMAMASLLQIKLKRNRIRLTREILNVLIISNVVANKNNIKKTDTSRLKYLPFLL